MDITTVTEIIRNSKYAIAFTGAGISVESGIPPFRGQGGLWNKYDPDTLDISRFRAHPETVWPPIKEIFYDHWGQAEPNGAHTALAKMEQMGILKGIVTMNIDALHQKAGSQKVIEYHGTLDTMVCTKCGKEHHSGTVNLQSLPPKCSCGGVLKPNFVFFGEGIPHQAFVESQQMAEMADVVIVVGTTGEVMPACYIPVIAKRNGAKIIEINPNESAYTHSTTTHYIKNKASIALAEILEELEK
ncbi:MAG: NAD-dependent deacylase [Bacteroidales bacterium]|nr:NAD-dependent deacylase [Bacteroidales bacterium]